MSLICSKIQVLAKILSTASAKRNYDALYIAHMHFKNPFIVIVSFKLKTLVICARHIKRSIQALWVILLYCRSVKVWQYRTFMIKHSIINSAYLLKAEKKIVFIKSYKCYVFRRLSPNQNLTQSHSDISEGPSVTALNNNLVLYLHP